MKWTRRLKIVFYAEIVLNIISIGEIFLAPDSFLRGLGLRDVLPVELSLIRWFGTLQIGITYVMARVLLDGGEKPLRFVLQGLLIGDFIYAAVQVSMVSDTGGVWTSISLAGIILTIFLIIARVLYLLEPVLP